MFPSPDRKKEEQCQENASAHEGTHGVDKDPEPCEKAAKIPWHTPLKTPATQKQQKGPQGIEEDAGYRFLVGCSPVGPETPVPGDAGKKGQENGKTCPSEEDPAAYVPAKELCEDGKPAGKDKGYGGIVCGKEVSQHGEQIGKTRIGREIVDQGICCEGGRIAAHLKDLSVVLQIRVDAAAHGA